MEFLIAYLMVIRSAYRSINSNGSPSIKLVRSMSVLHGRVPCDLNEDGLIETGGREENGCYAPGKQYLETPPDKPKTSFTVLAITSSLVGVSFGIGVGSEDTGVDDVASTTI